MLAVADIRHRGSKIGPDGLAAILTSGTTVGFTVIVIAFEVAVEVLGQVALEVKMHVTTSPFTSADVVNVVPPVPAFTPFTCH